MPCSIYLIIYVVSEQDALLDIPTIYMVCYQNALRDIRNGARFKYKLMSDMVYF
jgi:hypothetical protein